MASNPISRLHPDRGDGKPNRRLGMRTVELLQVASNDGMVRASKLLKLISGHIWSVKELHRNIIISLSYERSSYRPDWKITVKNGKVTRVNEIGDDTEMELADEPVNVTGAF